LLRVLQDGEVRPVGAIQGRRVDVRIIAATRMALKDRMAAGQFREDLYYRLCVYPITLPPLRDRPDDIPPLIDHFLGQTRNRDGQDRDGQGAFAARQEMLEPAALDALMAYDYPGNVRELRNLLERASLLRDEGERIGLRHLPVELQRRAPQRAVLGPIPIGNGSLRDSLDQYEALVIREKLRTTAWNQTRTAKALNISRRTLINKMERYKIEKKAPARRGVDT
jgi:sigma-54-dependent transcriptional regulator